MDSPSLATVSIDEPLEAIIERAREKSREYLALVPGRAIEIEGRDTSIYRTGLDAKNRRQTFESFSGNDRLVSTLKELSNATDSIVMAGKTGCGKTHLAVAMMQECQLRHQIFVPVPELLLRIRTSFDGKSKDTEAGIINEYAVADLLVMDDLGAEKTTEYSITTLYLILDRRNRAEKKTIVTTNLTLEEIEKSMGSRIASRLAEMKVIKITMPDYRKRREP